MRRFERVKDLPIYAGVLLDTSGSMADQPRHGGAGGVALLPDGDHSPKDRAAVITFSGQPNLAVRFTNDREVLAGGLAGLRADGNTALYDSVIYALYYFGGVRGKRAIVLLTDGKDEGSRFRYTDALEYAQAQRRRLLHHRPGPDRQGEPTSAASWRSSPPRPAAALLHRAGRRARRGVYRSIETELRSQYLLAYQSSKQGNDGKFRTVEVKLGRPGLEARTVPGYYP